VKRRPRTIIRGVISVGAFMSFELIAAALLALWVLVRYPRLGPTSLRAALLLAGAALAVLHVGSLGERILVALPHGAYVTLFLFDLPSLVAAFLTAGWVLRAFAGALGGSGGGTGHHVTSGSRA
jgi:hypothetical protein